MKYFQTVLNNAQWFRRSGIMLPSNGEWGVAERVAVLKGNPKEADIRKGFQAYTDHKDYSVIESRRADCNFEAAVMFYLLQETTRSAEDLKTAQNLVQFLYCRSGLLNRASEEDGISCWNWSHAVWSRHVWMDDNSWSCMLQIALGKRYPELDAEYHCLDWASRLAEQLLAGFKRTYKPGMKNENTEDPEHFFYGSLNQPHFGALMCLAFLAADGVKPNPEFRRAALDYFTYVEDQFDTLNVSERCYVLMAAPLLTEKYGDDLFRRIMLRTADSLCEGMATNPWSNLPAEHHEAPCGKHLADTIYTINWAFLGFINTAKFTGEAKYQDAVRKIADLLVTIQDQSPEPWFNGCWRGMYDLQAQTWGGGDSYEGGANSIYSGWTNAPISIGLMLFLRGMSMKDLLF